MILAPHAQPGKPDDVRRKARSLRLNFPVFASARVSGVEVPGLPYCVLFGPDGRCLYKGDPSSVEATVRATLGAALADASGLTEPVSALAPLLTALRKGVPPTALLPKLQSLTRSNDTATLDQAGRLAALLTAGAERRVEAAGRLAATDPLTAYQWLARVTTVYRGSPAAELAAQQLARLRANPTVQTELRAQPMLEAVRRLDDALRAKGAGPVGPEFRRANAGPLAQMRAIVEQMRRHWPTAAATKEAEAVAEKYGVREK